MIPLLPKSEISSLWPSSVAVQPGLCRDWSEIPKTGGGVAQWIGRGISDQGVPGSNPGRCTFRCGLEQVTFTLLSTG